MSLQINCALVTGVLMADGWHKVREKSFDLDAYEFGVYRPDRDYASWLAFDCLHGGGQDGVCATGFVFTESDTGVTVAGPLTAILAVSGGICGTETA